MPVIIDGTSGITTPAVDTTTAITAADGGTGQTSLTSGSVLVGNGTSAVTLVAAGSSGNVLTSNGTTWTSAAAGGGQLQTQLFTAPGTWTKPSSATQVRVTVVGGGAGSALGPNPAGTGSAGGSSSFGSFVSATGGSSNNSNPTPGTPGSGTVSTGTAITTSGFSALPLASNSIVSFSILKGNNGAVNQGPGVSYSTSSSYMAGSGGANTPTYPILTYAGNGGIAQAIVPVSAPVAVTVGSGGATNPNNPSGWGIGGAVVVEFVG